MGWRGCGGVVMATVLALGCTRRVDEQVRDAWGGATRPPSAGSEQAAGDGEGAGGQEGEARSRVGWDRVDEILDGAFAEASVGTDDEVMARLADRWCASEPSPLSRADGIVRVCRPDPPVEIDGQSFSLELGGEGVIGLVARGLSAEESSRLSEEARRRTDRWCTQQWTPPLDSPRPPDAPRLHTCVVEGSALLTVGNFFVGEEDQWQVSVVVIDAS